MQLVLQIPVSSLITRWMPRRLLTRPNSTIVSRPLTADSIVTEVMGGVRLSRVGLTTGFRLILTEPCKFVVLLRRETMASANVNGLQISSCLFLLMETLGQLIRKQITRKWWDANYIIQCNPEVLWVTGRCQWSQIVRSKNSPIRLKPDLKKV